MPNVHNSLPDFANFMNEQLLVAVAHFKRSFARLAICGDGLRGDRFLPTPPLLVPPHSDFDRLRTVPRANKSDMFRRRLTQPPHRK